MTPTEFIGIITGTSTVTAGILFVFKKMFEKALDARFSEVEKRAEAMISESARRQATIFDEQFSSLKALLALAYRMRNSARAWVTEDRHRLGSDEENDKNEAQVIQRLETYSKAFRELLYEHKAVLPPKLFDVAHGFQRVMEAFCYGLHYVKDETKDKASRRDRRQTLHDRFQVGELEYEDLARAVHTYLGVNDA